MKLKAKHPAVVNGHTIHTKYVKNADCKPVLKPVANNKKLGAGSRFITKGKWRNMPMFSLTLEERTTCPKSCHHWEDCYGNNMAFANRYKAGKELEQAITRDIQILSKKYPNGFVVRLHILGDFYSVAYTKFWWLLLRDYPALRVFGYTARNTSRWGWLYSMNMDYPDRCLIRGSRSQSFSELSPHKHFAGKAEDSAPGIVCPQQTGKTRACITCSLCWETSQTILFKAH